MSSKNRFHPKNIYNTPPNFKELAIAYPEFRQYVKQELSGRCSIDYQNEKAVKELTKTLLKKDFNLEVEIDEKRLIPRVPLCLNYILWIDDLLSLLNSEAPVTGVDIGTGNVCIYSLLAARREWKMLATEIDPENFNSAQNNITTNNLNNMISLKLNENSKNLLVDMLDPNVVYDFCMCNPPFYDYNEKPANRTMRRIILNTVASDIPIEVCTKGGEISFVKQLIAESVILRNQVRIFTTLVGKKCDFLQLKRELLAVNPKSMAFTEFCQGRTIRWGMAWTFLDIPLKTADQSSKNKAKKTKAKTPLTFIVPETDSGNSEEILEKIKQFLKTLNIHFEDVSDESPMITFKAVKNTWSHQRRKKRLEARKNNGFEQEKSQKDNCDPDNAGDTDDCSPAKKSKTEFCDTKEATDKDIGVEGFVVIKMPESDESPSVVVEMSWLSGSKESFHQIFQYLKNNWKEPN